MQANSSGFADSWAGMKSTTSGISPGNWTQLHAIWMIWKPKNWSWRDSASAMSRFSGAAIIHTERGLIQSISGTAAAGSSVRRSAVGGREVVTAPSKASIWRCSDWISCVPTGWVDSSPSLASAAFSSPSHNRTKPGRRMRVKYSAKLLTATANSMNCSNRPSAT